MIYSKVPKDRLAVLIGHDGDVKRTIEYRAGVILDIDSETGEVVVKIEETKDPVLGLKAADAVKAIARGFSPNRAYRLFEDETYLTVIDIRDYAGKSEKRLRQVRGRIIGMRGKTRRLLENLTGADMSVYGTTVSIIGDVSESQIGVKAVTMLLEGSEHSTVYHFLERQQESLKIARMGFEYYNRRDEE